MHDRVLRKLLVAAVALAGFAFAVPAATAVEPVAGMDAPDDVALGGDALANQGINRTVKLGLNKSLVVDLPRDARDVLVSNPVIADAVMRTPRRIYLTGVAVGQANIIVFDRAGAQIVTIDLEVERDNSTLERMLQRLIPDSEIAVEVVSDNIVLSGAVRNAADSRRAQDIATIFVNGGAKSGAGTTTTSSAAGVAVTQQAPTSSVVNLLTIKGEDQVFLKVTIAEVERNVAKQLGINIAAVAQNGGFVASLISNNPFSVAGAALSPTRASVGYSNGDNDINATLRALDRTGMVKTLAEPTLSAISGESASFLAGGEFPITTGVDPDTGTPSLEFKPYGVSLKFSPVVLSEGRISLHVTTEVSELSTEGATSLAGVSVPGLKVRRAESTVELPSGGSMVLGGLLRDSVHQAINGFPGLKQLPVLGTLFRSRDFQRNETELVIIVTPYLVNPVASSALARPSDGFAVPSDGAGDFLGRLNRVYGVVGKPAPAGAYRGTYGFIFE